MSRCLLPHSVMVALQPDWLLPPDFYSRRSRCLGTVGIFFFLVLVLVGGTLNEITMCVCTSVCVWLFHVYSTCVCNCINVYTRVCMCVYICTCHWVGSNIFLVTLLFFRRLLSLKNIVFFLFINKMLERKLRLKSSAKILLELSYIKQINSKLPFCIIKLNNLCLSKLQSKEKERQWVSIRVSTGWEFPEWKRDMPGNLGRRFRKN